MISYVGLDWAGNGWGSVTRLETAPIADTTSRSLR